MDIGMHQSTSMRLEQKLAPQMIQSINLLQATTLELEQMIQQEILVNPLLEIADDFDYPQDYDSDMGELEDRSRDRDDTADDGDGNAPEDRSIDVDHEVADERIAEDTDWEKLLQEQMERSPRDGEDLSKPALDDTWERVQTYGRTLEDHLLEQLHDRKIAPELFVLVQYLIELLDDDGYLRSGSLDASQAQRSERNDGIALPPLALREEIEAILAGKTPLEEASLSIREALHVLQSLEPTGVGARNLRECLLLQARRRSEISPQAIEILEKHFDEFADLEYAKIGKAMGLAPEQIKQIILHEIAHLHMRPGILAGGESAPTKIPDLMVMEDERGQLVVRLNDGTIPRLRISRTYRDMLQNGEANTKDKRYIRDKIRSADMLIKSIEQRKSTMHRVMESIVRRQKIFFQKGPGNLKPMILQDIAEEIGMHISTVNRVTNGKYVQTDFGVFELKEFFTAGVEQEDGSEVSSNAAKEAIRRLIAAEPKDKPYSDDQLVKLLDERENLKLARRTVTKYREAMGILASRIRKKL